MKIFNDDLISRQQAIAVADSSDYTGLSVESVKNVTDEVVKGLKQLPSVESEHKTGRWIPKDDGRYHCSSCDGIAPKGYRWNYCPNCGTDMRERDE